MRFLKIFLRHYYNSQWLVNILDGFLKDSQGFSRDSLGSHKNNFFRVKKCRVLSFERYHFCQKQFVQQRCFWWRIFEKKKPSICDCRKKMIVFFNCYRCCYLFFNLWFLTPLWTKADYETSRSKLVSCKKKIEIEVRK